MRWLCLLLSSYLLSYVGHVEAQTFFSDTSGYSPLVPEDVRYYAPKGDTTLQMNTANNSLTGSYIWSGSKRYRPRLGLQLGGKAANGAMSLFDSGGLGSELIGNIFIGFGLGGSEEGEPSEQQLFKRKGQVMAEIGFCRGTYYHIPKIERAQSGAAPSMSGMETPIGDANREEEITPSMFLRYNTLLQEGLQVGVSIGYLQQHNLEGMPTRKIVQAQPLMTTGNETETLVLQELTVREGTYEKFDTVKINADLLYVPDFEQHKMGFSLFLRYTHRIGKRDLFEPGFGIFNLTASGAAADNAAEENTQENEVPVDNAAGNEREKNLLSPLPGVPWQIAYGLIGQWNAEAEEFRFGLVGGYNF